MTTVYYAGGDVVAPEPVKCKEPGYPHTDVKGRTMYENSHFETIEEAWAHLRSDALAGEQLALRWLAQAETKAASSIKEARTQFIEASRRSIAIRTALGEGWGS